MRNSKKCFFIVVLNNTYQHDHVHVHESSHDSSTEMWEFTWVLPHNSWSKKWYNHQNQYLGVSFTKLFPEFHNTLQYVQSHILPTNICYKIIKNCKPLKSSSERLYDWIIVPIAPSKIIILFFISAANSTPSPTKQ